MQKYVQGERIPIASRETKPNGKRMDLRKGTKCPYCKDVLTEYAGMYFCPDCKKEFSAVTGEELQLANNEWNRKHGFI